MTLPTFEPRIVGFLCNWCSYAGADLAGTSRLAYPPNIRIVRVPCSGRVDPLFLARALRDGADGVLVLGCHPGDCHYSAGNFHARRRFAVMHSLLEFLGFERDRLRLDWVSASEGRKFADLITDFTASIRALGPAPRFASPESPGESPTWDGATGEGGRPTRRTDTGHPPDAGMTAELQALAGRLLGQGEVALVLGWESGTVRPRPLFARTVDQVARLVPPPPEGLNVANYLRALDGQRAAVVVRPGDARVIHVLIREGQLRREALYLIGVGGVDGLDPLPAETYDAYIGTPPERHEVPPPSPLVAEMEAWPARQRAAFWAEQFDQCQRCYACRQACPLCYCQECLAEQLDPAWQSIAIEPGEAMFFHALRAFHLAGRCGGCDACSAACPVGVPLYLLNQKIASDVARLFDGYVAGLSPETALPLTTFRQQESFAEVPA